MSTATVRTVLDDDFDFKSVKRVKSVEHLVPFHRMTKVLLQEFSQ